jgi:type II secretory ATPase GspE/PulE/Tfp pilus assembly ATPase PilB-like protein
MLIAVTGPIGSGKTLFMTRCIYREKLKNPDVTVATNYRLNSIPFQFINANDLFDIKQQLQNTVMGIDEFHIFLDSRAFMKPSNRQLTHFILQTRHLGVNLYFTTQDISQVDIRLRKQLDFLAYCSHTVYQDYFRVKIIDYRDVLNIHTNDFVYNAKPYYALYDTREIIDFMQPTEEVKREGKIFKEENDDIKRLKLRLKEYETSEKKRLKEEKKKVAKEVIEEVIDEPDEFKILRKLSKAYETYKSNDIKGKRK